MYDDETNVDSVFGTQEEFEKLYGKETADGVPRFGDDYADLRHLSEISVAEKLTATLAGVIKTLFPGF